MFGPTRPAWPGAPDSPTIAGTETFTIVASTIVRLPDTQAEHGQPEPAPPARSIHRGRRGRPFAHHPRSSFPHRSWRAASLGRAWSPPTDRSPTPCAVIMVLRRQIPRPGVSAASPTSRFQPPAAVTHREADPNFASSRSTSHPRPLQPTQARRIPGGRVTCIHPSRPRHRTKMHIPMAHIDRPDGDAGELGLPLADRDRRLAPGLHPRRAPRHVRLTTALLLCVVSAVVAGAGAAAASSRARTAAASAPPGAVDPAFAPWSLR